MLRGEFLSPTEFISHIHMTRDCISSICVLIKEKDVYSFFVCQYSCS